MAFSMSKRPELAATGMASTVVFKTIGTLWKKMPEPERGVWAAKAAQMTEARANTPAPDKVKKRVERKGIAPFIYYTLTKRAQIIAENPEIDNLDVVRKIKDMYHALSPEEKAEISKQAKEYKKPEAN